MPRGRTKKTMALIVECHSILTAIQPASIRAVCYRLFTRGLTPDMGKASTNRVSDILTRAREHGETPWQWIMDEHRDAERALTWDDPQQFVDMILATYRVDRWQHQSCHVEVRSEKRDHPGHLIPVIVATGVVLRVLPRDKAYRDSRVLRFRGEHEYA